jgi:Smr domain
MKQTGEEGTVVAYINAQMVEVEVQGITFPSYIDDIDHPYLKWFTEKKKDKKTVIREQIPVEKPSVQKQRLPRGVHLSFLPVFHPDMAEDIVQTLKVYLLNELPYNISYSYELQTANGIHFSHQGMLHAFGDVHLHTIDFELMNDKPAFNWKLDDMQHPEHAPEAGTLRIKAARLFQHIQELLLRNEPTFSYVLVSEFMVKKAIPVPELPPLPPPVINQPVRPHSMQQPPAYEIDLHIEQLIPDTKGLSNTEIIQIQIDALHRALDNAIGHRQHKLAIIHGLGKGVLRDAVHEVLRETPHVERFANEWHGSYGFGATEVWFSY